MGCGERDLRPGSMLQAERRAAPRIQSEHAEDLGLCVAIGRVRCCLMAAGIALHFDRPQSPANRQRTVSTRTLPSARHQECPMNINDALDKAYESMSLAELVNAPIAALQGVSDSDAELLAKAFNVKTIKDLAELKYVHWAQAIVTLAALETK